MEIPRYVVSIEIFDNDTQRTLADEHFNCAGLLGVEAALERTRKAIDTLQEDPAHRD